MIIVVVVVVWFVSFFMEYMLLYECRNKDKFINIHIAGVHCNSSSLAV